MMTRMRSWRVTLLAGVALASLALQPVDDLDLFVQEQMARREIVGLSLAIIDDGRVVETRAYGTTTRGGGTRVTPATLFQAGSISKPVAAVGALRLVQAGRLSLDEDVNAKLRSWRVPDNPFTTSERVTLRRLLSHTAGLTVHGFPGYAVTERVPSVPEVLDGKGNTPPVRVDVVPGSIWRYSGGGYTVMQQLVMDVTDTPFPDYMRDDVLRPLGMTSSTFQQPLPPPLAGRTAAGYYASRAEVPGRWHVYPEMAAAGLWTTPTDLARFAIGVQRALAGRSRVLSAETTRQMLTEEKGGYGLGLTLAGSGGTLRFGHDGRDEGFDALMIAYAESGDGVVIMINANDNSRMRRRIVDFVARKYGWPGYPLPVAESVAPLPDAARLAQAASGRYEFTNNNMLTLFADGDRLYTDVNGLPDEAFIAAVGDRFVSAERALSFRVSRGATGEIEAIEWTQNGATRRIPRIGPLLGASAPPADPDASFTRTLTAVLQQLAEGGAAVSESRSLTEGARKALTQPVPVLRDVRALSFVHAQNVAGRGIERHGHAIARVLQYRVETPVGARLLLVHLDPGGMVADYDVVLR